MWQIGRDFGHSSSLCLSLSFFIVLKRFEPASVFISQRLCFHPLTPKKTPINHQEPSQQPHQTSIIKPSHRTPRAPQPYLLATPAVYKISFQSLEEADGSCNHTYIYNVMSLKNPSEKKNHGGQTLLMVLCCPPVLIRRTSCYTTAVQDAVRSLL